MRLIRINQKLFSDFTKNGSHKTSAYTTEDVNRAYQLLRCV